MAAVLPMLFLIAFECLPAIGARLDHSRLLDDNPSVCAPPGLPAFVRAEQPGLLLGTLLKSNAALLTAAFLPFRLPRCERMAIAVGLDGVDGHSERHGNLCGTEAQ